MCNNLSVNVLVFVTVLKNAFNTACPPGVNNIKKYIWLSAVTLDEAEAEKDKGMCRISLYVSP